jgi:hypothetical protein
MTALAERLTEILPEGRANAIPARALARRLGVDTRTLQQLVVEAIERGVLIGSASSEPFGYFLIASESDLEAGTAHLRARALSCLHRWSRVRKLARERFEEPVVARLFELPEAVGGP